MWLSPDFPDFRKISDHSFLIIFDLIPFRCSEMLLWTMDNWPQWKHQFQIYVATLGNPDYVQKLIHFLEWLSPEGLAIAYKLFPQLVDYNLTADESIRFDEVWWQFNEHCWARYQYDPPGPWNDLLEDRMRLVEICEEAVQWVRFIFGPVVLQILILYLILFCRLTTTMYSNSSQFCRCAS